jgi:hypothetical protein
MIGSENDMERTTALTQTQLKLIFSITETARQIFDLDLAESAPLRRRL